jgi:hypothetical protein
MKVFLSHSTKDKEFVQRLADATPLATCARRRFGPSTSRICGKGTGFPGQRRIDLPHDSLRFGFERCTIWHRLLGPSFG